MTIIEACKKMLDEQYAPDGYNIGFNVGEMAGQTVMHCHIHIIPRYKGDDENPRGGIRGVIPVKKEY
ncbi:MAG: HIT family protein [Methanoregula sp.]|nr:HIT family protein [Methanoregula sp.]